MIPNLTLEHTYATLPERFFERRGPAPFPDVRLLIWNDDLARELGIAKFENITTPLAQGASPIAQAYSGHQFGRFNPNLGDGRALLLGELRVARGNNAGRLKDIHLKGSGPTRYSRGGDGRATLNACLREYLLGEGFKGLGIPSSRILAVFLTGETVLREEGPQPGAICVRVADSHIRVGTFEHFAARGDIEGLEQLMQYTQRRYGSNDALSFFEFVVKSQACLVAQWLGVGFVHGVMNTDNTFISGETLDFGPCAFIEDFNPLAVFSRIDSQGRYAYARQPRILHWNLSCLAHALLQLPELRDKKPEMEAALNEFPKLFESNYVATFSKKLGISPDDPDANRKISDFLNALAKDGKDFTASFRAICGQESANPAIIPRNHLVEAALNAATRALDLSLTNRLAEALRNPFESSPETADLERPAEPTERVTSTHCNT